MFWNKEGCTSIFFSPKQSCILLLRHRCDVILSGSFLLCNLYHFSLLGSQRPCSACSNVYAIQVFLQVLVNFTLRWVCFILLFSLRVVLVTFTILKQYGSKIERLLCKSKIARLLCKRQQIRLTLKCKGTLKGRETCFFYKSKFQSRRSHLRLEKINESRMRIWDRRNKHIIWLFRPPPSPSERVNCPALWI